MSEQWVPQCNELAERVGEQFQTLNVETRVIGARLPARDESQVGEPLTVPIYHTSTYRNTSIQQYLDILDNGGYIYQRLGNPTTETAELMINEMECGAGSLVYCSGLAAMNAVMLRYLGTGDHIVCSGPCYSGTYKFITDTMSRFGVTCTFVKADSDGAEYEKAIQDNTKMLYVESPCNPDMSIVDLETIGKLGQEKEILTVVDATFASPYNQQPIKLGIDIVLHSCTKYMGGHSDLIAGCVTTAKLELWKQLKAQQGTLGNALAAHDGYLLVRGLKTLPIRMRQHNLNAQKLAMFLEAHPKVKQVFYPGLVSHPGHKIASIQMPGGFGGMISFEMEDEVSARQVAERVRLISLAVSLGGVESLMEHPYTMTHGPMFFKNASEEDRRLGLPSPGLLRLSVGIENADDLINDLKQALE